MSGWGVFSVNPPCHYQKKKKKPHSNNNNNKTQFWSTFQPGGNLPKFIYNEHLLHTAAINSLIQNSFTALKIPCSLKILSSSWTPNKPLIFLLSPWFCLFQIPGGIIQYVVFSDWVLLLSTYYILNQKSSEIKKCTACVTSHYLPVSPKKERKKKKRKMVIFCHSNHSSPSPLLQTSFPWDSGCPGAACTSHISTLALACVQIHSLVSRSHSLVQRVSSRFHLDFLGSFHLFPPIHPLFPHSPNRVNKTSLKFEE